MGLLDFLFRRSKPPPPSSRTTVSLSPEGFRIASQPAYGDPTDRSYRWQTVSGACRASHSMKGVDVCTLAPPYIAWAPDDAEGLDELVAELERRGLMRAHEEVMAAWEEALGGVLDRLVAERFDPGDRPEADELLAPYRQTPRIALALVELSGGALAELRKDTEWAGDDPSSVVYSAWYAKDKSG